MEVVFQGLILMISLSILSFSSKKAVESAKKLASYLGLSELAIGFLLISFITSLPEVSIAVLSASTQNNNLSLGDLLGSNVTNIGLILGISLFLLGEEVKFPKKKQNQIIIYLILSLIPAILFIRGELSYMEGLILIVFYLFFIKQLLDFEEVAVEKLKVTKAEAAKEFIYFIISIFVVILSAEFVVSSAVYIAKALGLFESFIGAIIIALGTSLPELSLARAAIKKKAIGLSVGNLVGSNVVNITIILAINILINPFAPNIEMASLIFIFIYLTSGLCIYSFLKKGSMDKKDGIILLILYGIYVISLFGYQTLKFFE